MLAALSLACLTCFCLLPAQQKLLEKNLFEKAKTIYTLSGPSIRHALQTHDDITILTQIDGIMKTEDITSVVVLDNTCKVLLHNETNEWGKTYNDPLYKNAVAANKVLLQKAQGSANHMYSIPLASSSTLVIGFSTAKHFAAFEEQRQEALYISLALLLAGSVVFFLLIASRLQKRYATLAHRLKSVALNGGNVDMPGNDEFSTLAQLMDNALEQAARSAVGNSTETLPSQLLLTQLVQHSPRATIIFDDNNRVLAANAAAANLFNQQGTLLEKHFLDVMNIPEVIAAFKQAQQHPENPLTVSWNSSAITITAHASSEGKLVGTIVVV
jgi:PAS domain-containing protein